MNINGWLKLNERDWSRDASHRISKQFVFLSTRQDSCHRVQIHTSQNNPTDT